MHALKKGPQHEQILVDRGHPEILSSTNSARHLPVHARTHVYVCVCGGGGGTLVRRRVFPSSASAFTLESPFSPRVSSMWHGHDM